MIWLSTYSSTTVFCFYPGVRNLYNRNNIASRLNQLQSARFYCAHYTKFLGTLAQANEVTHNIIIGFRTIFAHWIPKACSNFLGYKLLDLFYQICSFRPAKVGKRLAKLAGCCPCQFIGSPKKSYCLEHTHRVLEFHNAKPFYNWCLFMHFS